MNPGAVIVLFWAVVGIVRLVRHYQGKRGRVEPPAATRQVRPRATLLAVGAVAAVILVASFGGRPALSVVDGLLTLSAIVGLLLRWLPRIRWWADLALAVGCGNFIGMVGAEFLHGRAAP